MFNNNQFKEPITLPVHEKNKNFTLSLKPSTRAKIHELALHQQYKSDSLFLEELIEEIYKLQK